MIQDVMPPSWRRPKPKAALAVKKPRHSAPPEPTASVGAAFRTPEQVAAAEPRAESTNNQTEPIPSHSDKQKSRRRWLPHGRKQWTLTSIAVVLILGGSSAGVWKLTNHPQPAPVVHKKVVAKKPVPPRVIYSDLSGLPITDPSLNSKPVTAVMVENSLDARPQSGLSRAGVVFEAQAEGGVTRFMALYQDTAPTNVGPIRSARPYYVQWALGFDAAYAHVGGSPDALSDITAWDVHDMNQFYNGGSYHRITTRAAPHNVYTGIDTLNQLEVSKGYTSTFSGFPRAAKAAPLAQPTASTINLAVSGPLYNPQYIYSAATNSYNRSTDGTPDTDADTGKQLSPTVVIAIVLPLSRGALDASGAYYSDYNVLGSGTAYIFQNGGVATGQWHKANNTDQLTFTDASGTAIPLNRGQTWITAVSAASQMTYTGTAAK